jgi:hypothetical protein
MPVSMNRMRRSGLTGGFARGTFVARRIVAYGLKYDVALGSVGSSESCAAATA